MSRFGGYNPVSKNRTVRWLRAVLADTESDKLGRYRQDKFISDSDEGVEDIFKQGSSLVEIIVSIN